MPGRLLGQVAFAVVLVASLAFTWSDATPVVADSGPFVPVSAFIAPVGNFSDQAHFRPPLGPAAPPDAHIPSARPVEILIPSLNVHRPIEAVGLDRRGQLYPPQNAWNGGWFQSGPVPGAPGDAVIEGHAGFPKTPMTFGRLGQLHRGDQIIVLLADGTRQLFLVASIAIWPAGTNPPGMGLPYGVPRLTLVTCTGPFDEHYKTYADRLVLEATYGGQY